MRATESVSLLALSLWAGACAGVYDQRVLLPGHDRTAPSPIAVTDNRKPDERETRTNVGADDRCVRYYGDQFIAPSKIEYLKGLLASGKCPQQLSLVIARFDTIEYCELTADRAAKGGVAAYEASLTPVGVPVTVLPARGRDVFQLRIMGEVNRTPFDVAREFDYSDLRFKNFPSENETYKKRLADVLISASEAICQSSHPR